MMRTLAKTLAAGTAAIAALMLAAPRDTVATSVMIDAAPETVWRMVADPAEQAAWNPGVLAMRGALDEGTRFEMTIAAGADRQMTLHPQVVRRTEGRELCWIGRIGAPRLLDGTHCYRLEPVEGGTRLENSESFRGVLLWVLDVQAYRAGFDAANQGLKARAESAEAQPEPRA